MNTFVGRTRELGVLSRMLRQVTAGRRGGFLSIRGRRRVGKSRLVEEFAQASGSPYVFYVSTRQGPERELQRFQDEVATSSLPAAELARSARFTSWEGALELAVSGATWEHPAVIVIDEFPYLVERGPDIEAVMQKVWDRMLTRQPVLLVLIGSDVATMETLSEHGRPLYDRPRELVVRPLTPSDVASLLRLDGPDAIDAYLVIGGFPELALAWGAGRTLWDFLGEAFEDDSSPLIVSGERALRAEFPIEAQARSVLSVVGAGERAFTAIQSRAGLARASLDTALRTLSAKQVVEKQLPYAGKTATGSGRWVVTDPYLRFWLRFVGPAIELVERGRGSLALDDVRAHWETYRGRAVEPIVRASIDRLLPDERFGTARHVGGYWTRDNRLEVDLVGGVAPSAPTPVAFVGSVKWRRDDVFGREDLAALAALAGRVPGADQKTALVGVSRTGFERSGALDVALTAQDLLDAWR